MSISWRPLVAAAILIAAALGLFGVGDALNPLVAAGMLAIVVLLMWPRNWFRLDLLVVRTLGAALVGILVLAGVNVVSNALGLGRLPIWLGLIVALIIFGLAAFWYLRRCTTAPAAALGAVALAVGLILVAPYVVGKLKTDSSEVPPPEPVASELDVLIVGDGSRQALPPQLPPSPALGEFDVRYSVGFADGEVVRWTLVDGSDADEALRVAARGNDEPALESAPLPRPRAESVLLLLPDGTPPVVPDPAGLPNVAGRPGEVARWQAVAASAGGAATPTFALLQTDERGRLGRWRDFASSGGVVSIQGEARQSVAEEAVRLLIEAPTSQSDLVLAMSYRPILLFDRAEPVPWPLSVNALFAEGRITLCHDEGLSTRCDEEPLKRSAQLVNGGTHIQIRTKRPRELQQLAKAELEAQERELDSAAPAGGENPPPGAGSTIYVHPVALDRDGKSLLYLDYWWYLPENPVGVGGGALCGAGFVIPGVTCQNHQSDWEGITVVVDRSGAEPRVVAVHYAQHDSVVKYSWALLRDRWDREPRVQTLLAGIEDAASRPLAFVAEGTHATYPLPCRDCQQVANANLGEAPHRGDLGWVGNQTDACGRSSCLQMIPTHTGGEEPALWNAYDGPWGERHCWLTYYCDSGSPPTAPGHQERYKHSNRYDGYVDRAWRFRREPFEE